MNKEKMLEVAKILFLNEVPKEQAKYIGSFIEEQNKEIERLNHECDTYLKIATKRKNIIDELEKIINDYQITSKLDSDYELICNLKDKLKELKGNKK